MQYITSFLESLRLGDPAFTADLTVFPLIAPNGHEPPYDTLKDAITAGSVRVTEISEGGSVPELRVVNQGARPVLIIDGEELVGAKQNRIVNITIMVPAKSTLTIPVSCVEAGRWAARSKEFAPAGRTYHASGRRAKVEQVSFAMRTTGTHGADQSAIWAEIDAKSARIGASSPTRAAAAMFEKTGDQLDEFTRQLHPVEGQVGAVFAIRGGIAGLDAFDCAKTWTRVMPGLVRSYGLDALDVGMAGTAFAKPEPARFLEAIREAPVEAFPAVGLGTDLRLGGRGIVGGSLLVADRIVHLVAFPAGAAARPTTRRHWGPIQ